MKIFQKKPKTSIQKPPFHQLRVKGPLTSGRQAVYYERDENSYSQDSKSITFMDAANIQN